MKNTKEANFNLRSARERGMNLNIERERARTATGGKRRQEKKEQLTLDSLSQHFACVYVLSLRDTLDTFYSATERR
jgi:hypothetical protein